jgi:hypothetical protein
MPLAAEPALLILKVDARVCQSRISRSTIGVPMSRRARAVQLRYVRCSLDRVSLSVERPILSRRSNPATCQRGTGDRGSANR